MLLVVLLCSFRLQKATEMDHLVMKAAEGQMNVFIDRIRAGDDNLYGFTLDDDLDECTVGKPYRILTLTHDFYTQPLQDDRDYIVFNNEWRAPVKIKGVNRNLLTVKGTSGNYEVTEMGDTTLAKELQMINKGTAGEEDQYYLLSVPELPAMFFVHETSGSLVDAQFIPLSSAVAAIPAIRAQRKDVFTLDETEQMIKSALTKEPVQAQPKKTKPSTHKKK